jgi:hypothetical protein
MDPRVGQSMTKSCAGLGSANRLLRSVAHDGLDPTTLKTDSKKYQIVNFESDSYASVMTAGL